MYTVLTEHAVCWKADSTYFIIASYGVLFYRKKGARDILVSGEGQLVQLIDSLRNHICVGVKDL